MHSLQTIHKLNRATLPITIPSVDHSDFLLHNHGSICLLYPLSADADTWVNLNLSETAYWFGSALVIEPHYLDNILEGIAADGLGVRS